MTGDGPGSHSEHIQPTATNTDGGTPGSLSYEVVCAASHHELTQNGDSVEINVNDAIGSVELRSHSFPLLAILSIGDEDSRREFLLVDFLEAERIDEDIAPFGRTGRRFSKAELPTDTAIIQLGEFDPSPGSSSRGFLGLNALDGDTPVPIVIGVLASDVFDIGAEGFAQIHCTVVDDDSGYITITHIGSDPESPDSEGSYRTMVTAA